MPIQIQTSFVPRRTPIITPPTSTIGGRNLNLFAVIAIIIFLLTVALSALAYFYKAYLINSISSMDVDLAAARKSFEPEFIGEASRLHNRIEGAKELLNNHRALSPLFDILEKQTLENMRFRDFNFRFTEGSGAVLSMAGQAKSFNAVALQSDVFGAERSFRDPVFSNFNLDESGDVLFDFKTTVAPELLRYREMMLGDQSVPPSSEEGDSKKGNGSFDSSNL